MTTTTRARRADLAARDQDKTPITTRQQQQLAPVEQISRLEIKIYGSSLPLPKEPPLQEARATGSKVRYNRDAAEIQPRYSRDTAGGSTARDTSSAIRRRIATCPRHVSPPRVTATCPRHVSPPRVTATCHRHVSPPRVTATCHRHVSQVNRKGKHTEELGKLKSAMAKRLETLEETLLHAAA